jgi:hypothetical protein
MREIDHTEPPPALGPRIPAAPVPAPTSPPDRRVDTKGRVREGKDGKFYTAPTGTP